MKGQFGSMVVLFGTLLLLESVMAFSDLDTLPECTLDHQMGQHCKIHVDNIRPTQFSYGPLQVNALKKVAMGYYNNHQWRFFQTMYNVPLIIGLGNFYLTDKHHHIASIMFSNIDTSLKYVSATIQENRGFFTEDFFWKLAVEREEVWLSDCGNELDPALLPTSIADLHQDPFRDIAYQIKTDGGYETLSVLYQEFRWADYFRSKIPFPMSDNLNYETKIWCSMRPYDRECNESDFSVAQWTLSKETQAKAMHFARHADAAYLPGFKSA